MGWLEGICGTVSDCCALKRDFLELRLKVYVKPVQVVKEE